MARNYWLDLFTGTTWEEFLRAGGKVSGFRKSREKVVKRIKPSDYLLCYCTGISRWIGLLEVTGTAYYDEETQIWSREAFPWRFPVKVIISLKPENAVHVLDLRDKLSYFQNLKSPHAWTGHFRGSPAKERVEDAVVVIEAIEEAVRNPRSIQFDEKKYRRQPLLPKIYKTGEKVVTIPADEEEEIVEKERGKLTHEDIQWKLIKLGKDLGLEVHVARNDRNKEYRGKIFSDFSLKKLPVHFDEATMKTIENIDVLWIRGKSIEAAFEIEHTSAIYSGILRMSDLVSMQPNLSRRR
ncbi:hypothetical protein MUP07_10870 [Candidatus Bathyarchaeota archaeon]|nr:hypothetical protein [Candidatus Bathyarchaeota archaeon]